MAGRRVLMMIWRPSKRMYSPMVRSFRIRATISREAPTRSAISCWVSFSGRRVKTDYAPRPLYQDDENYIVKPGEDVVLYLYESFTLGRDLEECAIKDVNWL